MLLRGFYESAIRSSVIRTFATRYADFNRTFKNKSFFLLVKSRNISGSKPFLSRLSFSTTNEETFESRSRNSQNNNNMDRILNVAEKNDAAKSLAEIMSRGKYRKREGLSVYNKIYEFPYRIFDREVAMVMTSVSGHLLNYEFNIQYKSWHSCNPGALFDAPLQKNCSQEGEPIKRTLEREIRNCDTLIIWTDCDREGENIGHEIVQVCSRVKPNIRVLRATFSEITQHAVTRAINNLGEPDKRVIDAVDVRQELDLRIGAAFTRFQTLRLQKVFPTVLSELLISYGSCQFPTLGFVVERYKQVQSFVCEPFWKIEVTCQSEDGEVKFGWKRQRLFDYDACRALYELCIENPLMTIMDIRSKPKSKWRPVALDTVELEKLASRKLKISAKETMKIAEKLYTQGYISYPRTETNAFPKGLDLVALVGHQTNDPRWGDFAQRLLEMGPNPRNGTKSDQAHPPIHPTKYSNSLQGNERTIYEFIVRHFLACCSQDAQGHETVVEADLANEKFVLSGLMILAKNYLEVYPYDKWTDKNIPVFTIGQTFMPKCIEMTQSETSPPSLLTEADLIALMEKHGIGTDATHAEHIETIKSRYYVGLGEDGKFLPGELGMGLVEGYDAMGFEMSKPNLRAELEADLKRICLGEKDKDVVLSEQIRKYKEVFLAAYGQASKIDDAMVPYFGQAQTPPQMPGGNGNNLQPLCKCPSCGKDMVIKCKRDKNGLYLTCMGYPGCKTVMWFPQSVLEAKVDDELCNQCNSFGFPMHKVKFKFSRDALSFGNEEMIACIGGCDHDIEELLGSRFPRVSTTSLGSEGHRGDRNNGVGSGRWSSEISSDQPRSLTRSANDSGFSSMPPPSQSVSQRSLSNHNNRTPSSVDNVRISASQAASCQQLRLKTNVANKVVCNCEEDAKVFTVRKEGPNKGRQFYCCPKPQDSKCSFFLWADSDQEVSASNSESNRDTFTLSSQPSSSYQSSGSSCNSNFQGLSCNCKLQAKEKTVLKEGPNKGRVFLSCPKPMGQGCNFFQWSDQAVNLGGQADTASVHLQGSSRFNRNNSDTGSGNKKKRKCGVCGEEGHTRKTCPHNR